MLFPVAKKIHICGLISVDTLNLLRSITWLKYLIWFSAGCSKCRPEKLRKMATGRLNICFSRLAEHFLWYPHWIDIKSSSRQDQDQEIFMFTGERLKCLSNRVFHGLLDRVFECTQARYNYTSRIYMIDVVSTSGWTMSHWRTRMVKIVHSQ